MNTYNFYYLDMYEKNGLWYENERHLWGEIELDGEPTIERLQEKSNEIVFRLMTGREVYLLENLSDFYIFDYYGDGTWFEITSISEDRPVFALELKEEE